jgi:mannose-6-phosphate isomerase
LPEVLEIYGTEIVGKRAGRALECGRFPLLVKLLDAEKRLSVQVHPSDDYALQHENGELGKTELWYVLHAQPGARIILGLRSGITPQALRLAAAENRIEQQLHFLPVRVGDAIFIPPGTVHAALEGLVINEVLQNSDTTYRVYDWGRVGSDGKPRPLHMDKAMEVMDFERVEPGPVHQVLLEQRAGIMRTRIVSCRYFVVEKISLEGGAAWQGHTNGETLEMWGTIQGRAHLSSATGDASLPAIKYCLVPAALGDFTIHSPHGATLLRIYLPPEDTA